MCTFGLSGTKGIAYVPGDDGLNTGRLRCREVPCQIYPKGVMKVVTRMLSQHHGFNNESRTASHWPKTETVPEVKLLTKKGQVSGEKTD